MAETIRPQGVSFQEAIDFYRDKIKIPTEGWTDLWQGQHSRAFTVAGATKGDLLSDLYSAAEKGLSEGITPDDFRKQFDDIVARHGWSGGPGGAGVGAWRSATIFNTNMRTAYQAGRYKQMTDPDVIEARPYWMYDAVNDNRTRPQHREWDGLILPADDAWWDTHFPPNGWGCRCRVRNLSERDLKRTGRTLDTAPKQETYEWNDPQTGEVREVPVGIDPGWDYNPGKTAWGRDWANRVAAKSEGPWVDLDPRGPAAFDRPSRVPAATTSKELFRPARDEQALRRALRDAIGADEVTLTDPLGDTTLVNQAIVDHMIEDKKRLDGREQYFPLIPELIEDPYEVWINFAKNEESGKVAVRKRYLKVIRIGKERVIGLVANAKEGSWESFTFFRGDLKGVNNLRKGRLLYGKE